MSYEVARSACVLFDLSDHGKLEAVGSEAAVFLHNLSTNDIKTLPDWHGRELFFCNVTARTLAHGSIWRWPAQGKQDRFWLDFPPGLIQKIYQHLDRHLISEDVTLTDLTASLGQFHLAGPQVAAVLAAAGIPDCAAMPPWTFRTLDDGVILRRIDCLGLPGFDLLMPSEGETVWRDRLRVAGAPPGDAATFDILRVEAGTPRYGLDLDETTFAPEVNRTAQAISYNKGCYLGQEPIVMARDRGIVQRSLVGLRLDHVVPPGSLLYRDGKEVGRTTSSVHSPRLGPIALAYVRRLCQEPGTALEVEAGGRRRMVEVVALPFA